MKCSTYQPLIDALGVKTIAYATPDNITFDQIKDNSLLIAGYDNPAVNMLFGKQPVSEDGLHVIVYKNPYNASERVALVTARPTDNRHRRFSIKYRTMGNIRARL